MNPKALYARTEKGNAEIKQSSKTMPARARMLLLLVDGTLTGAQLHEQAASIANGPAMLQLLEDGGYIEPLAAAAAGPREAVRAATVAAAAPPSGATAAEGALAEAKRILARSLHEALGPDADDLVAKAESALTAAELRVYAAKCRDIIISLGKPKRAAAFWQAMEAALPPD